MKLELMPGLAVLAVIAALGIFLYWSDNALMTTRYAFRSQAVPEAFDGFVIVQVSDLQSASFSREQERLARAVSDAAPDVIVFTGDLADRNHTNYEASLKAMERLTAIAPVYYC